MSPFQITKTYHPKMTTTHPRKRAKKVKIAKRIRKVIKMLIVLSTIPISRRKTVMWESQIRIRKMLKRRSMAFLAMRLMKRSCKGIWKNGSRVPLNKETRKRILKIKIQPRILRNLNKIQGKIFKIYSNRMMSRLQSFKKRRKRVLKIMKMNWAPKRKKSIIR